MINLSPNCNCKSCDFYPYFHYVGINNLKFHPEFKDSERFDIEFIKLMDGVKVINHTTKEEFFQYKLGEKWTKELFKCKECGDYNAEDLEYNEPFYIDGVCLFCRVE